MTIDAEPTAGQAGGADAPALSTSERLDQIVAEHGAETIRLGALLDHLRERAFGIFILVLALPCCIPFLYGVPQVVAVPLLFVTAQLVIGRESPWLPERFRAREIKISSLANMTRRARPYLTFFERISRPRLSFLTRAPMDRVIGLFLLCFSATILVPLPSTNTAPGIAVALVALGFLERDGLMVLCGSILGVLWIGFLIFAGATIVSFFFGGDPSVVDPNAVPAADPAGTTVPEPSAVPET